VSAAGALYDEDAVAIVVKGDVAGYEVWQPCGRISHSGDLARVHVRDQGIVLRI